MVANTHAFRDAFATQTHLDPLMIDQLRTVLQDELRDRRDALSPQLVDDESTEPELLAVTADRNEQAIAEIEHALERIDEGTYGGCERCHAPIPFERLEAMPAAGLCVSCQDRAPGLLG